MCHGSRVNGVRSARLFVAGRPKVLLELKRGRVAVTLRFARTILYFIIVKGCNKVLLLRSRVSLILADVCANRGKR